MIRSFCVGSRHAQATDAPGRKLLHATALALLLSALQGSQPAAAGDRLLWRLPRQPAAGGAAAWSASPTFAGGALASQGGMLWSAHVEVAIQDSNRIHVARIEVRPAATPGAMPGVTPGTTPDAEMESLGVWPGTAPGLAVLGDGTPVVVYRPAELGDAAPILARCGSANGRTWSAPVRVSSRSGMHELANGRLALTASGVLLVPAVWCASADSGASREVVCYRSADAGKTWQEDGALHAPGAADPAVAEPRPGELVMVLRFGTRLACSVSRDAGATWGAPADISVETLPAPHALAPGAAPGQVALAWVDPPPDSTTALPGIQALRLAISADAGRTWRRSRPLFLRPGLVPASPALAVTAGGPAVLVEVRDERGGELLCTIRDAAWPEDEAQTASAKRIPDRDANDRSAALEALRVLAAHTLGRKEGAKRLFVEAYSMRSLVAAYEAFAEVGRSNEDWLDAEAALRKAIVFGDTLLRRQTPRGYFPTGYQHEFWADMGAGVALFPALEPHVDSARGQAYEGAARGFLRALERDHMFLRSGALNLGWPFEIDETGRRTPPVQEPYLVSTALVGIETQAWLYHRTRRPEYRERALKALDYTLSRLQADGSLTDSVSTEKPLRLAAYVEEGWMAADRYLDDPGVRARLRHALPAHVRWLLRLQRADGTWNSGDPAEFSRTPPILDFLIWYEQRCRKSEAVRRAIRRAAAPYLDPELWPAVGLYRRGANYEVLRALWGRSLAALARGKFVL